MNTQTVSIVDILKHSVKRNSADCILFSGGLDTAIISYLNPGAFAINVQLEDYAQDAPYAASISRHLNLKMNTLKISVNQAIEAIPEVIKVLGSFDPAIPNDLAVYFGLKAAKLKGYTSILTGDGADEYFAGYSFMQKITNLDEYLARMSENLNFNSNRLGKYFGIQIKQPFLDDEVVSFAKNLPLDMKINLKDNVKRGKWVLRNSFEGLLPAEFVWQSKRPLEMGSGMTQLRKVLNDRISDDEYTEVKNETGIQFYSKEHLYYYKIYRDVVGEIPKPAQNEVSCPGCGTGKTAEATHCYLCGWVQGVE